MNWRHPQQGSELGGSAREHRDCVVSIYDWRHAKKGISEQCFAKHELNKV